MSDPQRVGVSGLRDDVIAFVAVLVMAGAGTGLFFRTPASITLGLVGGLTVGLGCSRWWRAALVGALGVLCGYALASLVADPGWTGGLTWIGGAFVTAALCAAIGAAVRFALGASARLRPLMAFMAVLGIVFTMWFSGLAFSTTVTAQGFVPVERLATTPALNARVTDEDIYLNYLARLRAGDHYYPMVVSVLSRINVVRPASPLAVKSPLAYRLPTLYWFLAWLPTSGALVDAMLVACTFGVIAAYLLAREFSGVVPSLASAALVGSILSGFTGPMLLDTESWAGIAGLCAVMFVVLAWRREKRALLFHVAAAACALLAASLRELGVAFIVLGLIAAVAGRRRRWLWVPWVAALAATGVMYAAHWSAARAAYAGVSAVKVAAFPWWHPDGSGLISSVSLVASHGWYAAWFAWILVVAGMIGAMLAPRDGASRVMLVGAAVIGPLALLALHPPGWATYGVPGYWGDLVLPTTLACAPLAFIMLPGVRRAEA